MKKEAIIPTNKSVRLVVMIKVIGKIHQSFILFEIQKRFFNDAL